MQDEFLERLKKKLSAGESADVSEGELREAAKRLSPEGEKRLKELSADPEALGRFLNAPGVREILKKLGGEG